MQEEDVDLEAIRYMPYFKKVMLWIAGITFCWEVLYMFVANHNETSIVWSGTGIGIGLMLLCYELYFVHSFRVFVTIDGDGIHVMDPKNGELCLVPWTEICLCKLYPKLYDYPAVCVLFRNADYMVNGKYLHSQDEPINFKREGKKILCDFALQKLSRGKISIDAFANRDVFGITVTAEQYERIKEWHAHILAEKNEPLPSET